MSNPVIPPNEVRQRNEAIARAADERDKSRNDAEFAIVSAIMTLAREHDAVQDIIAMEDVTIPTLTELANTKGVTPAEWSGLISKLTPLQWQLTAVAGGTWAECWQGLKSRFPMYVEQILSEQQQSQA